MKKCLVALIAASMLLSNSANAQKNPDHKDCEMDVLDPNDCPSWQCAGVVSSATPVTSPSGETETLISFQIMLNPSQIRECTMTYSVSWLQAGQSVLVLTTKRRFKYAKSSVSIKSQ